MLHSVKPPGAAFFCNRFFISLSFSDKRILYFFIEQLCIRLYFSKRVPHHFSLTVCANGIHIKISVKYPGCFRVGKQQSIVDTIAVLSQQTGLKAQELPAFLPLGFAIAIPHIFSYALVDKACTRGLILQQSLGTRIIPAPFSIRILALSGYSLS